MAEYRISTLRQGAVQLRLVQADSEAAARAQVGADEGMLLEVARVAGARRDGLRLNGAALGLLLQELSALLEAGLVLIEALEALRDKAGQGNRPLQGVLEQLLQTLYQGQPLSRAMQAQPAVFPELLVATVASSEGSGQLPAALKRYQYYEQRVATLRKRVTGALVYPAVVLSVGGGILLFMLFFVIPRFAVVFESLRELPATAAAMLWWARLVQSHGGLLGAGLAGGLLAVAATLRASRVRRALLARLWTLPKLRDVAQLFVLARFYRSAGLLIDGGTPALQAFELSGRLLPAAHGQRLSSALEELRAGKPVAATLARHGLTTAVAERLLRVGEQSGDLGGMCERIAHFHDGTLDQAIEVFSKVFEPILMLAVGGLVGLIVTLLYMPIFELAGGMG